MSSSVLDIQHVSLISNLGEKNALAQSIIKRYAAHHAIMDVGIGVVSLVPGAGIPAILAAITLQSKMIYRPMAEELAKVYMTQTDEYTDKIVAIASVSTVAIEFAQEFAFEFLGECAKDLLTEAGMGAAATFIPFAGAFIAAGLDYFIAQMLTWRVGAMTAIYFQNGGAWIQDRKTTMHIAKELTGGLVVSMEDAIRAGKDLLSKTSPSEAPGRFDLNEIPKRVSQVRISGISAILPLVRSIADKLPRTAVRECLIAMGLAEFLVDAALTEYYV